MSSDQELLETALFLLHWVRHTFTTPTKNDQFYDPTPTSSKKTNNRSVNQCLRHNLGYKQKILQFIRRNQVYFSSSNVSTDTTVIVKDYMLSEKFTFCFKITIKWNLTKSHATRLKYAKYNLM